MKKFVQELKEFAMRDNVIGLAVDTVIGGAFGQVTSSLVKGITTLVLSATAGKINLGKLAPTIPDTFGSADIVIAYGTFLQNVLDFAIIAFVIFIMIKLMSKLHQKKDEKPAAEPETPILSREKEPLTEIGDLLKGNNKV